MNIHHIDGISIELERAFDYSNLITLHKDVHKLFHDLYGLGDNTKSQFDEFVYKIKNGDINV